ncbi:MAG TPA: DUF3109 family protein [Bacteroidota bacterium]|nr:DUF3109 family protein [Bacteroidota bacterium]
MITVGNITVDEDIASAPFACDLKKCHGACCTMAGGRGAPLEDSEVEQIMKAVPIAKEYLSKEHLAVLESDGCVEGEAGDYTTVCVDNRACVFVYYSEGIARCSIEKAYLDGKLGFRKPISCHLYPIRVAEFDKQRIYYQRISECSPGRSKGKRDGTPLYEFLREPLIRKYGEQWYLEFVSKCRAAASGLDLPEASENR